MQIAEWTAPCSLSTLDEFMQETDIVLSRYGCVTALRLQIAAVMEYFFEELPSIPTGEMTASLQKGPLALSFTIPPELPNFRDGFALFQRMQQSANVVPNLRLELTEGGILLYFV